MLVLALVEVCGGCYLSGLDPLVADKRAFFDQVDVDLLDITELNEELVESPQVVKLVRDVVHDYAESFLFLNRQGRVGAPRRPPGHLSLQGLNLLQFCEGLTLIGGALRSPRVYLGLGGLQLLNQGPYHIVRVDHRSNRRV